MYSEQPLQMALATEGLSTKSSDEQACFTNRAVALQTPHRSVYPGSTAEGCVGGTGPQSKGHSLESAFQLASVRRRRLHNDAQSVRQRRALCCQPRDHPTTADTEPYSGIVRSRSDIPQLPRLEALTAEPRPVFSDRVNRHLIVDPNAMSSTGEPL